MSDLVGNPEDRFSHNEAHIVLMLMFVNSFYVYFVDLEPYWHIKHLKSGRLKLATVFS